MRTAVLGLFLFVPGARVLDITPAVSTERVANDPDDPAVWRHPTDASQSLILGTNKAAAPDGALYVFGLDGKARQVIGGLDRPNNVDVEGNLAVVTERNKQQLRVFRADPVSGRWTGAGAVPLFEGQRGEAALAMGIGLYRRPKDGALFAIVSRKTGPSGRYLWQYRLEDDGTRVTGRKVREFGQFSGGVNNEIEAVAVDDAEGYVYYSDETCCVRKYHADPDRAGAAGAEVARHATDKYQGQREGIAVTPFWLIVTDQIAGKSEYHVYAKRGEAVRPLFILRGTADSTDGIEFAAALPGFSDGLLIAMNSAGKNFQLYPLKSRY